MTAVAAGGKTKGVIISRAGDTMVVKGTGGRTTVILTDETDTIDRKGVFGLQKEHLGMTVLIPGLKVEVEGSSDAQRRVVAKTITVDGDDLETAEMIQSGLHPTAEQVAANVDAIEANKKDITTNQQNIAANKQQIEQNIKDIEATTDRFSALSDYDVKGQATVYFATGSARISPQDQEKLKRLAQSATILKGYIIEVTGFADSTGNAAMNTQLSENRAKGVTTFLMQQGDVPVRHIVAPGAMGEYGTVAPNETKEGRAKNRRVDVKVLVNKGIAGS
jgi:outer membrane protein OmpA-like peptidoglycan-associated protein